MTKKRFNKIILHLQKQDLVLDMAHDIKIDLLDFVDSYHIIINELIKEVYGKKGYEWFSWYCYDNKFGSGGLTAHHRGKRICYSHDTLWEYLEKHYNKKSKK